MWQSITELPHMIRSYHSGYSQLEDFDTQQAPVNFWHYLSGVRRWKLRHTFCLLLVLWLLTAYFMQFLEEQREIDEQVEFKKKLLERRANFLEALQWISKHLPIQSTEWSKSIEHLLDWHGRLNEVENFHPSDSKMFIFNTMTGVADQSRYSYSLSTSGRVFVLLWSPVALVLYYYSVWSASKLLFLRRPLFFTLICCLFLFGGLCAFVEWKKHTVEQIVKWLFDWTMFLTNVKSNQSSTSLLIQLFIHFGFWTLIFTSYRHIQQLKREYFRKLEFFGAQLFYRNQHGSNEFPERRIRLILDEFARRSLTNRLYLLFFFDHENQLNKLKKRISSCAV